MIHTIPYKIPAPILVNLENGNYDKIILFALAFCPEKAISLVERQRVVRLAPPRSNYE